MPRTPDEIWADDMLGRRGDASLLIGFIESVFDRPAVKDRGHAYTISIDAPYGLGKSFFLRRLSEELSNAHPVAFVDAWTDDLADEPLIALVSTLKAALGPLINSPKTKTRWDDFLAKSGKVAGIVTLGLLKRGAGLIITAPAVGAASAVLESAGEAVQGAVSDGIPSVTEGAIDDLASALRNGPTGLAARIAEFEAGQIAIAEMKDSLRKLVDELSGGPITTPIVIVIDELDRCRPSYAIKLFEEIKHLFDVPGIVFLFGIHTEQLAHSVKWAYGTEFNGAAYLKRFINRQYKLHDPDRTSLVHYLLSKSSISSDDFEFPKEWQEEGRRGNVDLSYFIHWIVDELQVTPRELFEFFDLLETASSLIGTHRIILPYFLPIVAARIRNTVPQSFDWKRRGPKLYISEGQIELSPEQLFAEFQARSVSTDSQIRARYNSDDGYIARLAAGSALEDGRAQPLADFRNYEQLVSAVRRFS